MRMLPFPLLLALSLATILADSVQAVDHPIRCQRRTRCIPPHLGPTAIAACCRFHFVAIQMSLPAWCPPRWCQTLTA